MKLYITPIDKMVKVNNLKQVTNPIYFERGNIPTSDGLFSTEIFGSDIKSRKITFAYIDLNAHFLHPLVYKMLKRMDRRIVNIVSGLGSYDIDKSGEIIEVENGNSGLEWLYKVWDKISFKKNESNVRKERIELLQAHPKDTIFCTKWIVIPPFSRDVNLQEQDRGHLKIHETNNLYSKLIRNAQMITSESNFNFIINSTRFQIQQTLEELYDFFSDKLDGKNGLIRKNLMSKSVTNANISVITNPRFKNVKKVDEGYINMEYVGVPLSNILSSFFPFVMYNLKRFLSNEFELLGSTYPVMFKDGRIEYYELVNPMIYFNEDMLQKRIDLFINTPFSRFDIIEIPVRDPKTKKEKMLPMAFKGKYPYGESSLIKRPATWMDLFYMAAEEAVKDKYVVVTRHPVLDTFGSFIARPRITTTTDTEEILFNDKVYQYYPKVDLNMSEFRMSVYFIDTLSFSNVFAPGLGADYDGDTVTVKGIWTQQGNINAEKARTAINNIVGMDGNNRRILSNEAVQTLYNLTK